LKVTGVIGAGATVAVTCTGATLRLRRSTVVGNTGGGGVSISNCEFSLVNNVIALNGAATSTVGGVQVSSIAGTGLHEFQFNTVTANTATSNVNTGLECGLISTALAFANNIVYGNQVSGTGAQVGGDADCAWTYSDIGPQTVVATGNINADPQFVDAGNRDYHLMSGSPAVNAADSAATVDRDLDGDMRPQGSGPDMGADEVLE
jgi:hypothetical protein